MSSQTRPQRAHHSGGEAAPRPTLRCHHREGGQATAEFALLLPLLLLLLFGTIEFGQVFVNYLAVVEAAHDAARVASLGATAAATSAAAQVAATAGGLGTVAVTVTGSPVGGPFSAGSPVTVEVSYGVPIIVPLFWPILGHAFQVATSVTMVEEG